VNLGYADCPRFCFLKRHRKFWCGEMCIWVVSTETKTPGYPCPTPKFTKRFFSPEKFPPTHAALGFANIRPNEYAGRSCRNPMLVRIDGNKNELVAIPKTTKTFIQRPNPHASNHFNCYELASVMLV